VSADKPHPDLRDWIELADSLGCLKRFQGASWDLEVGALTSLACREVANPPCLLFDEFAGFPAGWRVLTNAFTHTALASQILGMPAAIGPTERVKAWREKTRQMQLAPVRECAEGPVFQNVRRGSEVDLLAFPAPRWNEHDGGRYLGTGDIVVTRDPDSGQVNVGTYRMMLHDRDKIGLYISPGHHGRIHRDKYFARGERMPVVAVFGMDPLLFVAGGEGLPESMNEYEWVGAVRGGPVEVVRGPVTGLPIPAHAEIAIEGFVQADRVMDEGPLGEFTGYYASGTRPEAYVQVEALYHRDDPIILGSMPMRPPADYYHVRSTIRSALVWDALESAGVPDVQGVAYMPSAWLGMLVVAIRQRYAGHARQAGMIAAQCRAGAYLGRYVVVVDDDIDVNNVDEVLWALWTRSEPADSIDLVRNCWSTGLDPRIPPEKRGRRDLSNSRLLIDATRPFHWREQYPRVANPSEALLASIRTKWGNKLFT